MKKRKIPGLTADEASGVRFYARKYALTTEEAKSLVLHPRRAQIIDVHERWLESVGYPAHDSPLSRGYLLDLLRGREVFANPLLGVSGWYWAAGAAVAAVVGYLVLRKEPSTAAGPVKQVQGGIPPVPGATKPAEYVQKVASLVGGYGSAYEKKPWASRRTSQVPAAARNIWTAQEIAFKRRRFERAFWMKGQVPPAMKDDYFASKTVGTKFSPPIEHVSSQKFLIFRPQNNVSARANGTACAGVDMSADCEAVWGWNPTDEYGNAYEGWGVSSDPLNTVLLVTQTVLPYIPGVGSAAAATFAGLVALGQGKSLDEAAFAAVRAGLPPGAQLAFDLGVGVVLEKKPVDQALTDAALGQLEKKYPGSKAAYSQGKALAKQHGLGRVQWSAT